MLRSERIKQKRVVALKHLPKVAVEGSNKKGHPRRSQATLDHERTVLIEKTAQSWQKPRKGPKRSRDYSND
jgi:hypothetical protein